MTLNPVYKALRLRKTTIARREDIEDICRELKCNATNAVRNLQSNGYLVRIFRGIFYVRSLDEVKFDRNDLSAYDLLRKGMEMKRIDHWYLGLHSALKLNALTHEVLNIEYVVNDTIFRQEPFAIASMNVKFIKMKKGLVDFGIITDPIPHSDPEKTILDIIYLSRYNGRKDAWIRSEVSEHLPNIDIKKAKKYCKRYPGTVGKLFEEINV